MVGSSKRRFGSSSSQTSQNSGDICRICHCESETQNPLLTPCYCSGSLKYVHQSCLQQWLTASETTSCELCKFPFIMHTKIKPFNEWRALQMSGIERRRLFCSVLFHCAAATCVIWSLCVLIERATEEVKRGLISWPFWTKLVVVTVGLTGGVVFMYIQCKAYLSLCTRWRARNRILLIQNAPEKIAPPPSTHEPIDLRDSPPLMFNRSGGGGGGAAAGTASMAGSTTTGTPGRLSNTSGMGTQVSTMALNRSVYSAASHGQIVANIESNSSQMSGGSHRQSRDWTNVYVEDMGGFQSDDGGFRAVDEMGAGAGASSRATQFNSNMHHHSHQQQQPLQQGGQFVGQVTPSTAIFLENQDILSDTQPEICSRRLFDEHQMHQMEQLQQQQQQQQAHLHHQHQMEQHYYPSRSKFNRQRHSLWVDSNAGPMSGNVTMSNNCNQSDFRRYSDTRLIMEPHDHEQEHQIFNVVQAAALGAGPQMGYSNNHNNISSNMSNNNYGSQSTNQQRMIEAGGGAAIEIEESNNPQITDILFESAEHGSSFDPLELNIQELLELDIRTNVRGLDGHYVGAGAPAGDGEFRSSQLSVNSDPLKYFKGDSSGGRVAGGGGGPGGDRDKVATQAEQKHLLTPQSLPNLSASCEDLDMLQQQHGHGQNQQRFQ